MTELAGRPLAILTEGRNYAHVAVPTADGSVQTVIVWADADEQGNVILSSAEGRAWPRNLREAGRATVTLMADGNPYEYVSIRGTLVEATHDGADADIDRLTKKYMGLDAYPYRQPGEQRVTLKLRPDRITYQGED